MICRRIDETLPLEFDIPGQETVGPGGFFFALRSIPEAHRVADVLLRKSPDALFINYTNPSNIVTQSLIDRGDVNVVGLCDQSDEDLEALSEALGIHDEQVSFTCCGLNHATWYTDIQFGDKSFAEFSLDDGLPMPRQIDREHELRFRSSEKLANQYPGYWPNSYLPYYLEPQLFVEHSKAVGPRSSVIQKSIDSYYRHFEEESEKERPQLEKHRGSSGFGDLAVSLLRALASDEAIPLVLNIENRSMTGLFKPNTVVEARLMVSVSGIIRESLPTIPGDQKELLIKLERYQRLTAGAALAPTRSGLVEALHANPLVPSVEIAEQLLERALQAYPVEVCKK